MTGHRPLTDEDRDAVRQAHAEGLARNAISRRIGRAPATVSKLAAEMGLTFDRSASAVATAAKVSDGKARRAQLALDLLGDAERLRRQLWVPCVIHNFGGKDNTHNSKKLDQPVFADQLKIVQAAGLAVERHARLVELDNDQGGEAVRSLLDSVAESFGLPKRA